MHLVQTCLYHIEMKFIVLTKIQSHLHYIYIIIYVSQCVLIKIKLQLQHIQHLTLPPLLSSSLLLWQSTPPTYVTIALHSHIPCTKHQSLTLSGMRGRSVMASLVMLAMSQYSYASITDLPLIPIEVQGMGAILQGI